MRGERVLRNRVQPKTWPKRTLNGYKMKRKRDNAVLIDVDSEGFDNVIVIDVPDSLRHKLGGSSVSRKGKKFQFRGVIRIDDDEDVDYPEMGTDGGLDLESSTSSGKSFPASDFAKKSVDLNDDECHVVQEKNFAFRVSKCKQTSGKDPFRGRYGLSESSSSDTDGSDCEVMEGSSGQLHKEWEKAFLKKKFNVHKGKSGLEDQASPSCFNDDATPNVDVGVGERAEQPLESDFCCDSSNYKKQKFPPSVPTDDGDLGTPSLIHGMKRPFVESNRKVDRQGYRNDGQCPQGQSFWSNQYEGDKQYYHRRAFHQRDTAFEDEEVSLCKNRQPSGTHDNNERVVPNVKDEEFSQATSNCCSSPRKSHHTTLMDKEKPIFGEPLASSCRPSYATGDERAVAPSEYNVGAVFEEYYPCKTSSSDMPGVCNEKASEQDTEKPDTKSVSLCKTQCTETQSKQGSPCLDEINGQVGGTTSTDQLDNGMDHINAQGVSIAPAFGEDIINEREKLKQTDEYKRAMEEEWASRQRQLQIQAEESQRLRKKKRAESMRLLDMERRQKQRLEEIRETQKKDEENLSLKEQLRVEVRKELYKLEMTCIDMASLLRALGIHVGGNFHPLSQEVHAAYKRALLRFHPDRASKTDLRQQVEAEEKFKLISHMKEKFLLTTYH